MHEEFSMDTNRVAKARILTDLIILIVVGCGLLAVTAWFTSRPILFYITAGISSVISIVYVMVMIITGFSQRGSGYIPVCILLFIIGILVTHKFLAGILPDFTILVSCLRSVAVKLTSYFCIGIIVSC